MVIMQTTTITNGVAAMSAGEGDLGGLVGEHCGSTSGGAANDAMQEDALLLSSPGAHLLVCHLGMQHNAARLI